MITFKPPVKQQPLAQLRVEVIIDIGPIKHDEISLSLAQLSSTCWLISTKNMFYNLLVFKHPYIPWSFSFNVFLQKYPFFVTFQTKPNLKKIVLGLTCIKMLKCCLKFDTLKSQELSTKKYTYMEKQFTS